MGRRPKTPSAGKAPAGPSALVDKVDEAWDKNPWEKIALGAACAFFLFYLLNKEHNKQT